MPASTPPHRAHERMSRLFDHIRSDPIDREGLHSIPTAATQAAPRPPINGGPGTLTVRDHRTGQEYTLEVGPGGNIPASAIGKIKAGGDGAPLRVWDPGYVNTVPCISRISYIDGDKGILRYRGIPIEEIAERSSFLETAYLLLEGRLPTAPELRVFSHAVANAASLPEGVVHAMEALPRDAHPMACLMVGLSALGAHHPDTNPALAGNDIYKDPDVRASMVVRVLGAFPTIAAYAYHRRAGTRPAPPNATLGFAENFLYMLDAGGNVAYRPHPALTKALDVMFLLHAEHELNCSTSAMRHLASSGVDVCSSAAGAVGALYGPLHGGANEAVLKMLARIGTEDNIPAFIEGVKNRKEKMFGFGHRVYKNYDPRAKVIRGVADKVFAIAGVDPLIKIAEKLEKIALSDPYFVGRKLYPNVDFYSGLVYRAMGFPPEFFTVLFAVPRMAGWLSHWLEAEVDPDMKIARPQQDYRGPWLAPFTPITARTEGATPESAVGLGRPRPPTKELARRHAGLNWT